MRDVNVEALVSKGDTLVIVEQQDRKHLGPMLHGAATLALNYVSPGC